MIEFLLITLSNSILRIRNRSRWLITIAVNASSDVESRGGTCVEESLNDVEGADDWFNTSLIIPDSLELLSLVWP